MNWAELGRRFGEDSSSALDELLGAWREANGVESAALYVGSGPDPRRVAGVGGDFPDVLSDLPLEPASRLDLGEATLVYVPQVDSAEVGPLEMALRLGGEIRRLRDRLRQRHFEDSYRRVELEAVYELGLAIASTLDLEQLSDGILMRAVALCDARRGALYVLDEGRLELAGTIGGEASPALDPDDPEIDRLLEATAQVDQNLLPGATFPLAVPIEIEGARRGLLAVADKESRQGVGPFQEADRRTLGLFANQAAIALENARLHQEALEKERLEREMELAAEIQQRLLPKGTPVLPGFELAGWNRPAWQVGGDYYGFVSLGSGRMGLVVADVTGKGMPAALLVSTLHSALRLLLEGSELGCGVFAQLNEHIVDSSSPNKFITLIMVDLDPDSGELRFLNAGHNPGLLVSRNGEVAELTAGGMPLGLLAGSSYEEQRLEMRAGDLLCLYSDGITECESPAEEEFGLARLQELLHAHHSQPLQEILSKIDQTMREFAAGRPQGDDQTVVLLRRC